ncbi:MAG TPA: peptidoglycan DD-metalloendopeptidase family protein [Hyphomicrobiales bacterium]|nr:peptidoglycan DD-metalloendopeptidase family protein [Hyphomicrobiales bacterium]
MRRTCLAVFALLMLAGLQGCGSNYKAPVEQIGNGPRFLSDGRQHRVNDGETLYVIAWMYDLDVNALARANNLPQPYAVEPGMMLTVDPRQVNGGTAIGAATPAPEPTAAVATAVPRATGLQRTPLATTPLPSTPLPERETTPPVPAPSTTPVPAPAPRPAPEVAPSPAPEAAPPIVNEPAPLPLPPSEEPAPSIAVQPPPSEAPLPVIPAPSNVNVVWDWPHRGNIVGRFTDTAVEGKGVDLAGEAGDPVLAAADGEVVYAGSGLLRYGNLLILKHNDRLLSAYAHNRALLVKEGEMVKRGQKIAELGSSGVQRNMLHFEIREDGKPVDPMLYLPGR